MIDFKKTGIFTLAAVMFFVISAARSQTPDTIYTIPKGTKIRVRMDNEINSKVSSVNDTFTVTTATPVVNRGAEILPIGTIIEGRILEVKKAAFSKKRGRFEVKFETLYLPEGKRRIEAAVVKGEEIKASQAASVLTIAGAAGIGGLLGAFIEKSKGAFVGAGTGLGIGAGIVLLQKGEEARIKANEEFDIVLLNSVTLPPKDY